MRFAAKAKRYRDKPSSKAKKRNNQLQKEFGMTLEQYNALLLQQGGACKICRSKNAGKELAVDHDHRTGKVRGLLCSGCNLGLGNFRDDPESLRLASIYLMLS